MLLALPIVWMAVYGRWRDVVASIVMTSSTLALPVLVVGGEQYPVAEWRRVVLSTMTFTLTGLVVNHLVTRLTRHQAMLATIVEVTRGLEGTDLHSRVCDALRRATGADQVTYWELRDPGQGSLAAVTGRDAAPPTTTARGTAPLVEVPAEVARVVTAGQAIVVTGTRTATETGTEGRAWVGQPVTAGETTIGVLVLGWSRPLGHVDTEVTQLVEMLAAELAAASERARLMGELERMAKHDQLTGALNRRAWDEIFERELYRLSRRGGPGSVAMFDLDHFKAYNDLHGHLAGDRLLVAAVAAWTKELRGRRAGPVGR